ncbi:hypothetical protein PSP6_210238 [Paraburkholderia tropica]|nr:hypothetical protein PSP6_210238 [Paraburkholderia tropica]
MRYHSPLNSMHSRHGIVVRLDDLLKDGPVVLTFYRGQYWPFQHGWVSPDTPSDVASKIETGSRPR